ncbi:DUF6515 family protein [Desulfobacter postgatei]|uniref:DUF6515 family protein n=1 Tax=Desulfobacter postgatei TaxID=2293 RepID=UPI00259B4A6B|nr:DUF6515 family protein [uncultured Desulfobacter sp.]
MNITVKITIAVCCLLAVSFGVESFCEKEMFVKQAEARVGRPVTPISVAGVARRTTRRTIRRTAVYVSVLPIGYSTVVISGVTLYHYGGVYYQAQGTQYVVVNVD